MIENIYITDVDDNYAPPEEPVLEVGLVGDVAYLSVGNWTAGPDERKFEATKQIGVPVTDLVNALKVLAASQQRHDLNREFRGDLRPVGL